MSNFEVLKEVGKARRGVFTTPHGKVQTPAFMPVGTQATVKGLTPRDLKASGAEMILSNTYHLHLRPGDELIRELGGLHKFMNWEGPILTDSGGFQVFSLATLRKLSDEGVSFNSHIDGARIELTPEKVVLIQENLGVDVMMVLDECLKYPATRDEAEVSLRLTQMWAARARTARRFPEKNFIFGIMQGGMFPDLRKIAAVGLIELDFDGYAVGGMSVGEPDNLRQEITELSAELLPKNKIRYLMGVGTPFDLVRGVSQGIDLFDCVMPTRSARFGRLFISPKIEPLGHINIRNKKFRTDSSPLDESCSCYCCQNFSRAYLSHLIHSEEVLFVNLASIHNIHYYQNLMRQIRESLEVSDLSELVKIYSSTKNTEKDTE